MTEYIPYFTSLVERDPKAIRWETFWLIPRQIPVEWLTAKTDIETVEQELSPICAESIFAIRLTFQVGDEVWRFSTPQTMWQNMLGAAGYAFVRNGKQYDSITVMRS